MITSSEIYKYLMKKFNMDSKEDIKLDKIIDNRNILEELKNMKKIKFDNVDGIDIERKILECFLYDNLLDGFVKNDIKKELNINEEFSEVGNMYVDDDLLFIKMSDSYDIYKLNKVKEDLYNDLEKLDDHLKIDGVSYKIDGIWFNKELNKGITEYIIKRLFKDYKPQSINYYFADLLISIYGDNLLKIVLDEDIINYIEEEEFDNIRFIGAYLDSFNAYYNLIYGLCNGNDMVQDIILKYLDLHNHKIYYHPGNNRKDNIKMAYNELKYLYKLSLKRLLDRIVIIYNNCNDPKIDKEEFCKKLNIDGIFEMIFTYFDSFEDSVSKELAIKKKILKK